MNQLKLFLITVIGLLSFCEITNAKVVYCYYGTRSYYRPGDGKFEPSDIDSSLCTHVAYSSFGISKTGGFKVLDNGLDLDSGLGFIKRTMALKQSNPKLKVIAAVGGANESSINFSNMAADAKMRQTFIASTLKFIREYGFDGLDLDWEYPAQRGGSKNDVQNFVTLLKEIKKAFEQYQLELIVAVGAPQSTASISYDIPSIAKYVNYINVMTNDLVRASNKYAQYPSPLRGTGQYSVESSILYWLQAGAPAEKLVIGLAFYGRSFLRLPNIGTGSPGPFTQERGFMAYNEICSLVSTWFYDFDSVLSVPSIENNVEWIGYDNVRSIELKMDFMNSLNLAGAMVWSIDTDDFRGNCGEKYPLLKAVNRKLNES